MPGKQIGYKHRVSHICLWQRWDPLLVTGTQLWDSRFNLLHSICNKIYASPMTRRIRDAIIRAHSPHGATEIQHVGCCFLPLDLLIHPGADRQSHAGDDSCQDRDRSKGRDSAAQAVSAKFEDGTAFCGLASVTPNVTRSLYFSANVRYQRSRTALYNRDRHQSFMTLTIRLPLPPMATSKTGRSQTRPASRMPSTSINFTF